MRNLSRTALIVLGVGIICLLIAPYLITRPGSISFKETGTIGDTIGGITAPITGLIGSVLVFLALRAQIAANEIIQGQISDQKDVEHMKKEVGYISDLYKYFLNSIDGLSIGKNQGGGAVMELMNIAAALDRKYAHDDNFPTQGKLPELFGLLKLGKMFLIQVNKSPIGDRDKEYFKELTKHHIESYVLPGMFNESKKPPCEVCGDLHNGVPFKIVKIVQEIEKLY